MLIEEFCNFIKILDAAFLDWWNGKAKAVLHAIFSRFNFKNTSHGIRISRISKRTIDSGIYYHVIQIAIERIVFKIIRHIVDHFSISRIGLWTGTNQLPDHFIGSNEGWNEIEVLSYFISQQRSYELSFSALRHDQDSWPEAYLVSASGQMYLPRQSRIFMSQTTLGRIKSVPVQSLPRA